MANKLKTNIDTSFRGGRILEEPYGYPVYAGYLGWVKKERTMRLFATEQEYYEYIKEGQNDIRSIGS